MKAGTHLLLSHLRDASYAFVTPTPATHARVNSRSVNAVARNLTDIFGWSRPFKGEQLSSDFFANLNESNLLTSTGNGYYKSKVRVSTVDEELFIHGAFPTNETDAVFLGPDTYRFVAALREAVPLLKGVKRAVDIGCGAGVGGVVLSKLLPHAQIVMVDINDAALALARTNAAFANCKNVSFAKSNLLNEVSGEFDLIVSNPPYLLDERRRDYRHGGGDFGEGLSLQIVQAALERLTSGGTLVLYTGSAVVDGRDAFRNAAEDLTRDAAVRFSYRELDPDVFGEELERPAYITADRIAAVLLTLTKE